MRLASRKRIFAGSDRDWQEAGCNSLCWTPGLAQLPAHTDAADTQDFFKANAAVNAILCPQTAAQVLTGYFWPLKSSEKGKRTFEQGRS